MGTRFEVTILGCSSATPTSTRYPTAQIVNLSERFFLIDCGEGAQIQMRRFKVRFQRINHIFISHLHGDHYLGLMGFISSLHLLGRKKELTIYHPKGLKEIVDLQLELSGTILNYPINWVELNTKEAALIYEDQVMTVETVILNHRIPCCGFIFREKEKPKSLVKDKLKEFHIPIVKYQDLKDGKDITLDDGTLIRNEWVTRKSAPPRSYAFCSDTRYSIDVADAVKHVDLLYHEATFLHELISRAEATFHSTAKEAGLVATHAKVKKLLIGHYSVRYNDLAPLLAEAQKEFPNTELAKEGEVFTI